MWKKTKGTKKIDSPLIHLSLGKNFTKKRSKLQLLQVGGKGFWENDTVGMTVLKKLSKVSAVEPNKKNEITKVDRKNSIRPISRYLRKTSKEIIKNKKKEVTFSMKFVGTRE